MRSVFVILILAGSICISQPASAQGLIVDDTFRRAPLELQTHTVDASLDERLGVVTVAHTFHNPGRATVEGTFLFPLPPDAQISRFSMTLEGKEMTGELLDADEARRIYEAIVRRNIDPALLEWVDYRTFRARIFPIPPGASRTITLRYDTTLPQDGQTVTFRYPLQGNVASRNVGGRPQPTMPPTWEEERVHSRVTMQTVIKVSLQSMTGVKNVFSPSHPIETQRPNGRKAEVTFEASEVLDGKDFVLTYRLDPNEVGAALLPHRPYRDLPGYFMLLLDPPSDERPSRLAPQDIVFVLDTSGSMSGEKMAQAQDALRYCLSHLGANDRFGVVAFSSDLDVFRQDLRPASTHEDALYFVDQLEARGGTNIHAALLKAAQLLEDSERGLVLFLTDGLPSVGTTDEEKIRTDVAEALSANTRLFAFGVGYDVNTRLLDGLADERGTFADYISPDEKIDARIASFFDKVRHPVLTDVSLDFDGGRVYALAPNALPDLYKGSQLILAGRYRQPGQTHLTLRGTLDGQSIRRTYRFTLPETQREQAFVGRLWATRRVGYLLDQIRLHGENVELKQEVIALAKEFGLVTPYTSYLVQEEEFADARPNESNGLRSLSLDSFRAGMDATSGESAVAASRQIRAYKEADTPSPASPTGRAIIDGRTMQQTQNGTWLDTDMPANATLIQVAFGSEGYFALLRAFPEARAFSRLGASITFTLHGRWIQIGDDGHETTDEAAWRRLLQ